VLALARRLSMYHLRLLEDFADGVGFVHVRVDHVEAVLAGDMRVRYVRDPVLAVLLLVKLLLQVSEELTLGDHGPLVLFLLRSG